MEWTKQRLEELRVLWLAGYSAVKIARFYNCTIGTINGKKHRLGLDNVERETPTVPIEQFDLKRARGIIVVDGKEERLKDVVMGTTKATKPPPAPKKEKQEQERPQKASAPGTKKPELGTISAAQADKVAKRPVKTETPAPPAATPPRPLPPSGHSVPSRRTYPPPVPLPAPSMPEAAPDQPARSPVYVEEPGTATVLTLGENCCKWPIGDPDSDNFTFCGRRRIGKGPYCEEHGKVAYQSQEARSSETKKLAHSVRRHL